MRYHLPWFGAVMLCMLTPWPAQADAQIYKWVDEQGNVHFSNHPRYAELDNTEQVNLSALESNAMQKSLGQQIWQQQCSRCHYVGFGQEGEKTGISAILTDDYREKMLKLDAIMQNLEQVIVDSHLSIVQPVPNNAQIRALAEQISAEQQAKMVKISEPTANSSSDDDTQ